MTFTPAVRSSAVSAGAGPRSGRARSLPGEQLVEDRHPHDQPALDLGGDQRLRRVDHLGRELDAAVDRAGVHQELARVRAGANRSGSAPRTRGARGRSSRSSARAASAARRRRRPRRGRRGRRRPRQPSASIPRGISVGGPQRVTFAPIVRKASRQERATRLCRTSPTIQMLRALERAEALAQREDVEQRLARVLVLAVAGVDHRGLGPAGDQVGGARVRRADHDRRRVVGGEGRDRVLQRLALVDRGAGRLDADHVGGEPLRGELEGGERPGARLVEEVDDGAARAASGPS